MEIREVVNRIKINEKSEWIFDLKINKSLKIWYWIISFIETVGYYQGFKQFWTLHEIWYIAEKNQEKCETH